MERNFEWQNKADIKSLTLSELTEQLVALGQPKFRGKQIYSSLHDTRVKPFDEMTNLSAALRAELSKRYYINPLSVLKKLVSKLDGIQKFLLKSKDNNCQEAGL